MANILDRDITSCGVPVHNPLYRDRELRCSFDFYKLEVAVGNRRAIEDLVPPPLEYSSDTLMISANQVRQFSGALSHVSSSAPWNEVVIQLPVRHNGTFYWLNAEIYLSNFAIAAVDREMFGFPKVPAQVEIRREGSVVTAMAESLDRTRRICALRYEQTGSGSTADLGAKPRVVNFRHIPSPVQGGLPQVKELVALNYLKQAVHAIGVGEGTVELFGAAPDYLHEAQLGRVVKAVYMDLELHVVGGKVLHDYLAPPREPKARDERRPA